MDAGPSTSFPSVRNTTESIYIEEKQPFRVVNHFKIRWTICDFLRLSKYSEKSIRSPPIRIGASDSLCIVIVPYFLFTSQKSIQFCLLREAPRDKSTVFVTYRFGIMKTKATWFNEQSKIEFPFNGCDLLLCDILEYFEDQNALHENTLVILCEVYMTYNEDLRNIQVENPSENEVDMLNLSFDFYKLCKKSEGSDVIIRVKDYKYSVHKVILVARSSVFAEMLKDNCSFIDIIEEDYPHIQNIISYMYTANFYMVAIHGVNIGLYECAKRYNIHGLIHLLIPTDICLSSVIKEDTIDFHWQINKFSTLKREFDDCITSPSFHVGSRIAPVWYLDIYPEGNRKALDNVGIYVRSKDTNNYLDIRIHIDILDEFKCIRYSKSTDKPMCHNYVYGFPDYISKKELHESGILKGDKLLIDCKINGLYSVNSYEKISSNSQPAFEELPCLERLSKDMEYILADGAGCSDCSLVCNEALFLVHRAILQARCPTLHHIVKEAENNDYIVNIEDITPDVLEEMLYFIYTGKMESYKTEFCMNLYEGAKMYTIATLGTRCIKNLIYAINDRSLCDTIFFANKHEERVLLSKCLAYLLKNKTKILNSEEWQRFVQKHQGLAYQVYKWLEEPTIPY